MRFRKADYVWLIDADVVYASRGIKPEDSISIGPAWEMQGEDVLDLLERLGVHVDWSGARHHDVGALRLWRSAALSGTVTWQQVWARVNKNGLSLRLDSRADDGSIESCEQVYSGKYQVQWAEEQ